MSAQEALGVLLQFGTTDNPDVVADVLLDNGIVGTPRDCATCPIAEYLNRFAPIDGGWAVTATGYAFDSLTGSQTIMMPRSVTSFVRKFDAGSYPMIQR